jgi:comEA protein
MRDRNLAAGLGRAWLALLLALALGAATAPARAADAFSGVVNVNTATSEELQLLPGVGESRARAIVEARKARGGFKSVEELVEVKGIGSSLLEQIRPFLVVNGKTTAQAQ